MLVQLFLVIIINRHCHIPYPVCVRLFSYFGAKMIWAQIKVARPSASHGEVSHFFLQLHWVKFCTLPVNLLRFLLKNWPFFRLYIPFLRGQSQPFWAPWVHFGSPRQTDFGATGVNFVGKNQIYILYVNLHCVLVRNEFGGKYIVY